MKDSIFSILRHLVSGLAGLGGFLVSKGLADPGDAAALDAAGAGAGDALAAALAIVLARLLMGVGLSSRPPGTAAVLAGTIGLAGFFGFGLPACSPAAREALRAVPVEACYVDKAGNSVCYSPQKGVTATVDRRGGK